MAALRGVHDVYKCTGSLQGNGGTGRSGSFVGKRAAGLLNGFFGCVL